MMFRIRRRLWSKVLTQNLRPASIIGLGPLASSNVPAAQCCSTATTHSPMNIIITSAHRPLSRDWHPGMPSHSPPTGDSSSVVTVTSPAYGLILATASLSTSAAPVESLDRNNGP